MTCSKMRQDTRTESIKGVGGEEMFENPWSYSGSLYGQENTP